MKTVSDIVEIRPGQKGRCPHCGHRTMSVRRDDTLAKCFHPSCGRFVTTRENDGPSLSDVLDDIFREWRAALPDTEAWRYVVEVRGIKPQVVADSMLGAVPPNYSAAEKFEKFVASIEKPELRRWAEEAAAKFARAIAGRHGALAFFYTDVRHRITSIKLRWPNSKDFAYFKPFKRAGLFGHGLFSPSGLPVDEYLLVVEGEFNQLAVQSIVGEYVHCAAVGGAGGADFETIKAICRKPVIAYDNDDAGLGLVRAAQEHMTVEAFTTPFHLKDLDEWVRAGGQAPGLAKLIAGRTTFFRSFGSLRREIEAIRHDRRLLECQIHRTATNIVLSDLKERGSFHLDGQIGHYFNAEDKLLSRIVAGSDELKVLLAEFGLNASEKIFGYAFHAMHVAALKDGARTEIRKWSHYDVATGTHYAFNLRNAIYRLRPGGQWEKLDNGVDGVLFAYNRNDEPWELTAIEPGRNYLREFITSRVNFDPDGPLTVGEYQRLLELWVYAAFFPTLHPTRPILALIGEKGSGKSTIARIIGRVLTGRRFNVSPISEDHRDFDSMVANNYFPAIDNVDSRVDWLCDRLATIATGQTIKVRPLYKDITETLEVPTSCFPIITSRTPHFRRDDVADRLLLFPLRRFEAFEPDSKLVAEILSHRNEIVSYILEQIRTVIHPALQRPRGDYAIKLRMADFADFALRTAPDRDEVEAIFAKLTSAQSSFALDNEPLFELLLLWAPMNGHRWVTGAELYEELVVLAEEHHIAFHYRSGRSMGQRLRNIKSDLAKFFDIEEKVGRSHTKLWRIAVKPEGQSTQSTADQSTNPPVPQTQSTTPQPYGRKELGQFGGLDGLSSLPNAREQEEQDELF